MRRLVLAAVIAGCGSSEDPGVVVDAEIIVDGYNAGSSDCRAAICVHNENTDMIVFGGATFLVHRTAESQVLGPNSSLRISRSDDHGATWNLLAVLPAINGRDLRDPHFYVIDGKLAIKALTRKPVVSTRDSFVDTISVGTISPDGGRTWDAFAEIGPVTWSYWRIIQDGGTYYNAAYEDGDLSVRLFSSTDGRAWTMGPVIYDKAEDTPLETELMVYPDGTMLALVRMDGTNDELLGSTGRLRTAVCWSSPPYASFACPQELEGVRLDGPVAFFHDGRLFVVARKHFLEVENRKRTALYEILGPEGGPLSIVEHAELPSTGDTAYAGVARIADGDRYLVTWYSSVLTQDGPWARAILGPTDVWQATLDLGALK
ncbi:MAG: exo-alpha-sialidase [Deltaproteobacteria bacterium]|nr:exo-alpha-sialidase [Deltaproteobacteria bacterium]